MKSHLPKEVLKDCFQLNTTGGKFQQIMSDEAMSDGANR